MSQSAEAYFGFDLAKGRVGTARGARVVLLSEDVLATLVAAAVRQGDLTSLRQLGHQLGNEASQMIGGSVAEADVEGVAQNAATVLALFGYGDLSVERWGQAAVLKLGHTPRLDSDQLAVAALLGGMLTSLSGHEVACVPVGASGDESRFLVTAPEIAEQVWSWSRQGETLGTIVDRLQ
jgi:hypothetical protein